MSGGAIALNSTSLGAMSPNAGPLTPLQISQHGPAINENEEHDFLDKQIQNNTTEINEENDKQDGAEAEDDEENEEPVPAKPCTVCENGFLDPDSVREVSFYTEMQGLRKVDTVSQTFDCSLEIELFCSLFPFFFVCVLYFISLLFFFGDKTDCVFA